MNQLDLETVYERLATAIDQSGEEKSALMLAKLSLLMARDIGNADRVLALIDIALRDLDP